MSRGVLVKLTLVALVAASWSHQVTGHDHGTEDWWKHMQLYQIYPRSFMDSDGDGIGDLNGITQKLDHLKDIGVTATWLSPIFVSPMKDFGYDIEDFFSIAKEYGTMEDFEKLIRKAKEINIKILLDFVPNHSSDKCSWFQKSVLKDPEFVDYYVWHPGTPKTVNNVTTMEVPNNWISVFRKSAWTWHPVRKEYYLHQFLPEQPDLNYRNPKVVWLMNEVLKYWLRKGVDGFRVDAIPHLVEVEKFANNTYPDEPRDENGSTDPDDYGYLQHIHTRERDETYEQVYGWRKTLDDFTAENKSDTKILLMEAMSDIDLVMKYYGNGTHEGAHFPFNFNIAFMDKRANATDIKDSVDWWFGKVPGNRTTNWVAGNHDQPRVATRFGEERSDGVMMMNMLLPGVSVTYQGEEIAMTNFYLSYNDTQDPQACNAGEDLYNTTSRDPERTPFHWNNKDNAGFSTNSSTWLPVASNYKKLNLDAQKAVTRSAYKVYKALSGLRKHVSVMHGDLKIVAYSPEVLTFKRSHGSDPSVVVLINTREPAATVNLMMALDGLEPSMEVLVPSTNSRKSIGQMVDTSAIELGQFEALVLKSGTNLMVPYVLTLGACLLVALRRW